MEFHPVGCSTQLRPLNSPTAHLLASALGGIALLQIFGRLRPRPVGTAVVGLVLTIGAVSPLFASVRLTEIVEEQRHGFLYGDDEVTEGSFVRRAAEHLGPDDVVEVEDDLLGFYLWQFSGARIARSGSLPDEPNVFRIRFRDLARRWDQADATGSFTPDWSVEEAEGDVPGAAEEVGEFRGRSWVLQPTG